MQQATITLTSAQILALNATPVEVVPAPPAGRALQLFGVAASLHFATTAYANGAAIHCFLGPVGNAVDFGIVITAGLVNGGQDEAEITGPGGFGVASGITANIGAQPLNLSTVTAFITGDSTLTVTVFFGTVKLA